MKDNKLMTKQFIRRIKGTLRDEGVKITIPQIDAVLWGIGKTIENCIYNEEEISVYGLFSLEYHKRNAKIARDPRTGNKVEVDEKSYPKMKLPSKWRRVDIARKTVESDAKY